MRVLRTAFASLIMTALFCGTSWSQVAWYVDDDNCPGPGSGSELDPFCSIQAGIDAAGGGDSVEVMPGTYLENLNFNGRAIVVRSVAGPEVTTVDGGGLDSVVTFENGEGPASVLRGFTLTNGRDTTGGGILCWQTSPTIVGNAILGNHATTLGGGIGSWGSPLISGNLISDNSANSSGGGIYFWAISSPVIEFNFIHGNTAGAGGGIFCVGSGPAAIISNNVIANNSVSAYGGGVGCLNDGNSTFKNNTIVGNFAGDRGGAIAARNSNPTVRNSILWGNTANVGEQLAATEGSNLTVRFGDVEGGEGAVLVDGTSNLDWGEGLFDLDPQFRDAALLDFVLLPDSPCVDSGPDQALPTGLDIGGVPRLLDGDLDGVMVLDLGAHEFSNVHLAVSGSATPGGTLTFDSTGTDGLVVLLFVGSGSGEILLPPYGPLFMDLGNPWQFFPFSVIPDTRQVIVPADVPAPLEVVLQGLGTTFFSRHGNTSKPVTLRIE